MKTFAFVVSFLLASSVTLAQEGGGPLFPPGQQPEEFESVIQKMKFEKPTRILQDRWGIL